MLKKVALSLLDVQHGCGNGTTYCMAHHLVQAKNINTGWMKFGDLAFRFELWSAQQEAVVAQIIGIVGFGNGAVVPLCLKCPPNIHFLFRMT